MSSAFQSKRSKSPVTFATEEQRDLFDWMYDFSLGHDTPPGALAWGLAMEIAAENPTWTFWQITAELRRRATRL